MKWTSSIWAALGFLSLGADAHKGNVLATTVIDPTCTANVTLYSTIINKTTKNVEVVVPHTVHVTNTSTVCVVVSSTTTQTTTVHCTVSLTTYTTKVLIATVTNTTTTTQTLPATTYTTTTNTLPETTTTTTTKTLPATTYTTQTLPVTTYTTTTVLKTKEDPCPTICAVSAATVNLLFWPTDRPYSYPATYYDTRWNYTFTSPSVYMYVPTAKGTKPGGEPYGPNTASWWLPLRLDEVSTIQGGTLTKQLSLSDLRTDCPQTAEAGAIATMIDSACDPILAAPRYVSSWAYPCNACSRFGLFDPPYAVPTVTGGLRPPTTTAAPVPTTAPPPPPTSVAPPPPPTSVAPPPPPPTTATTRPTTTGPTGQPTSSGPVTAAASSLGRGMSWAAAIVFVAAAVYF